MSRIKCLFIIVPLAYCVSIASLAAEDLPLGAMDCEQGFSALSKGNATQATKPVAKNVLSKQSDLFLLLSNETAQMVYDSRNSVMPLHILSLVEDLPNDSAALEKQKAQLLELRARLAKPGGLKENDEITLLAALEIRAELENPKEMVSGRPIRLNVINTSSAPSDTSASKQFLLQRSAMFVAVSENTANLLFKNQNTISVENIRSLVRQLPWDEINLGRQETELLELRRMRWQLADPGKIERLAALEIRASVSNPTARLLFDHRQSISMDHILSLISDSPHDEKSLRDQETELLEFEGMQRNLEDHEKIERLAALEVRAGNAKRGQDLVETLKSLSMTLSTGSEHQALEAVKELSEIGSDDALLLLQETAAVDERPLVRIAARTSIQALGIPLDYGRQNFKDLQTRPLAAYLKATPEKEELRRMSDGALKVFLEEHAPKSLLEAKNTAELFEHRSLTFIEHFLKSPDPSFRILAVGALGDRYDAAVSSHLEQALKDPNYFVRVRAAEVLAQRPDPESAEQLRQFGQRMSEEELKEFLEKPAARSLLLTKGSVVLLETAL